MTARSAGATLLTVLTITVSACTNAGSDTRPACEVPLPASWQQAFASSGIATGGSTKPLAVGPAGEIVAVRDTGNTRDLLLIGRDRSITTSYTVPDPEGEDVEFTTIEVAAVNDRWIVIGVSSSLADGRPFIRNGKAAADNGRGISLRLNRIDVIDRQDSSVRTIVRTTDAERQSGDATLDSVALFADTVYWITQTNHNSPGVLRSYDLNTGAEAEVASGAIHNVRATPAGITWFAEDQEYAVRNLAPLPDALAAAPGIDQDEATLVGDGTNYAWMTGLSEGGTGIAWWSPDSGLTRVTTRQLFKLDGTSAYPPPVHIEWPYVVLGPTLSGRGSAVVDTRSAAIANLDNAVVDAGGGTIATKSEAPGVVPFRPEIAGLVRTDGLPRLSC